MNEKKGGFILHSTDETQNTGPCRTTLIEYFN